MSKIYDDSEFYKEFIAKTGGKDNFIALPWQKIYSGIYRLLFYFTEDNCPSLGDQIDEVIRKTGILHAEIENEELSENQRSQSILSIIDIFVRPRTMENRLYAALLIFPDYYDTFELWLQTVYTERNREVHEEVQEYVAAKIKKLAQEEAFLKRSKNITFGREHVKTSVVELNKVLH